MTDIVERLRAECDDWHTTADRRSAEIVRLNNEIERLRVKARETEADYQRATDDLATLSAMCDALRADAEAFRLAVKLRLHVGVYDRDEDGRRVAIVSKWSARVQFREALGDDECAAVRRAIGKVENAIGKTPT